MKLTDFLTTNPLAVEYIAPPGKTARELVTLLLARQKIVYGYTIVEKGDVPHVALTRNMKALMKKYSLDDIKRGIELSVTRGDHPASTKFIEEQILWRKELTQYQPFRPSE